jgi:hypothetical protein
MPDLQTDQDSVSAFLKNYMAAQPQQANPFAIQPPAPAPSGNPLFNALAQQQATPPAPAAAAPSYKTALGPDDESNFQDWVKKSKVPFDPSPQSDYDMRGYYKAMVDNPSSVKQSKSDFDGTMHFPDTWKTPYHKTFSNESIYAPDDAPHWEDNRLIDKTGKLVADETPAPKIVAPGSVTPGIKVPTDDTDSTPFPTYGDTPEDKAAAQASAKAALTESSKSGLDNLWGKTSNINNPFLKALARVGVGGLHALNAAGSIFAPEVEAQIPGTPWHHQMEVKHDESEAAIAQARATAATANVASQVGANADDAKIDEDKGTYEIVPTTNGLMSFSTKGPDANKLTPLIDKDGKPIQPPTKEPTGNPDFHVLANGDYGTAIRDPKTGNVSFKVIGHVDPKVETDQTEVMGADGKPHKMLVNKATGKQIADLGQAFVKPDKERDPLVQEMAEERLADSETTHLTKRWNERAKAADSQIQKIGDTLGDLAGKNGAMGQSLGIPKMLTGLLSGASTGIRITQAELQTIGRNRGIGEDVVGFFTRMESGAPLTPHQVTIMRGILSDVRTELFKQRDVITEGTNNITNAPDRAGRYASDQAAEKAWVELLREQSGANGPVVFNVPGVGPHTFPNQAALDGYKKEKGIK